MRFSRPWRSVLSFIIIVALSGVAYVVTDHMTRNNPVVITEPKIDDTSPQVPDRPTTSAGSSQTTSPPTTKPIVIAASRPTELYLPRLKKGVKIAETVCPTSRDDYGNDMLDPDRHDYTKACYFTSPRYPQFRLPGTNASDVVVLAGHTWRDGDAAFNLLYNWKAQKFTVHAGDEVWMRTVKSGKRWLVYRATDTITAQKYAEKDTRTQKYKLTFMNDPAIWGMIPTPGVLVTVGCLQPRDTSLHSSRNVAIRWQFDRVEKG